MVVSINVGSFLGWYASKYVVALGLVHEVDFGVDTYMAVSINCLTQGPLASMQVLFWGQLGQGLTQMERHSWNTIFPAVGYRGLFFGSGDP